MTRELLRACRALLAAPHRSQTDPRPWLDAEELAAIDAIKTEIARIDVHGPAPARALDNVSDAAGGFARELLGRDTTIVGVALVLACLESDGKPGVPEFGYAVMAPDQLCRRFQTQAGYLLLNPGDDEVHTTLKYAEIRGQ